MRKFLTLLISCSLLCGCNLFGKSNVLSEPEVAELFKTHKKLFIETNEWLQAKLPAEGEHAFHLRDKDQTIATTDTTLSPSELQRLQKMMRLIGLVKITRHGGTLSYFFNDYHTPDVDESIEVVFDDNGFSDERFEPHEKTGDLLRMYPLQTNWKIEYTYFDDDIAK